jgi:hypothetical protein
MKPHFFNQPDMCKSENLLTGTYRGMKFCMADYAFTSAPKNAGPNSSHAKGRMLIIYYGNNLSYNLKVMEKSKVAVYQTREDLVTTNDIEFDKKFNVYTKQKEDVKMALTSTLRQAILKIEKQFDGQIYFAFENGVCYVAINDEKNSFNLTINKPITKDIFKEIAPQFLVPQLFIDALDFDF